MFVFNIFNFFMTDKYELTLSLSTAHHNNRKGPSAQANPNIALFGVALKCSKWFALIAKNLCTAGSNWKTTDTW